MSSVQHTPLLGLHVQCPTHTAIRTKREKEGRDDGRRKEVKGKNQQQKRKKDRKEERKNKRQKRQGKKETTDRQTETETERNKKNSPKVGQRTVSPDVPSVNLLVEEINLSSNIQWQHQLSQS